MAAKWRPIPIIGAAYSDDCRPWSQQDLCNYIPVSAEMEGTRSREIARSVPGLQEFAAVPGARKQRGGYVAEGRLLFVADTTLYQQMPNGSIRTIGTIPGSGRVTFAHNQIANGNEVAIANGSSGYIYNTVTDTLTQITDSAFQGGKSVVFIDQMFVWIEPQGRQAFPSALADGLSYNGTEDFQGESKPDRIVGQIVADGELLLFNEQSLEHFQSTGVTNELFSNKGLTLDRGCGAQHAIVNLDQATAFIGNDGNGYLKRGYQIQRITTHPIEQAWAECDLSKAFAFVWEDRGHKVVYFTFPDGMTWGYDVATQKWHRRRSDGMNRWRLAWLVNWRGEWYGGEYNSGRIFRMNWDYMLEGCDEHPREGTSGVLHSDQNRVTLHGVQLVLDAAGPLSVCAPVITLVFDTDQQTVDGVTIGGALPDGAVGDTVNFQYRTIGGVAPVTLAVTAGSVPAGTVFADGAITGTYTTAEHDNAWTVTATDAEGNTATLVEAQYVMDMLGYPPGGLAGDPYSYTLTGSEGTAPYTFVKTAGTFVSDLALASDGEIAGANPLEGTSSFSVTMTDAAGVTQTKMYSIDIAEVAYIYVLSNIAGTAPAYYQIDPLTNTISDTAAAADAYKAPVVSIDGTKLFLSNGTDNKIGFVTLATEAFTPFASEEAELLGTAADPTDTYLYSVNQGVGNMRKTRISDGVAVDTESGIGAGALAISPDGLNVSLVGDAPDFIYDIVAETRANVTGVTSGIGTAFSQDGTTIYSTSGDFVLPAGVERLQVVDVATKARTAGIDLPYRGRAVKTHPNGLTAAVACFSTSVNELWIVDLAAGAVTETIAIGAGNHQMTYNASGTRLYVTNSTSDTVSVIDTQAGSLTENTVIATITGFGTGSTGGVDGGIAAWPRPV